MLQKSSILRTAEPFFIKPMEEYSLVDISRDVKLAHTSVKKNLNDLVKLKLINETIKKKGSRKFPVFKANVENEIFKTYKKIYNITSLFESGIIKTIDEKLAPKAIVLFGSYLDGEDTETSDIDIFVECKKENIRLEKFERILKRKIELHFNDDFLSYPKELKNNIINGMVLSGFLEVYK
jgi:predicted nucleotidyltransferase